MLTRRLIVVACAVAMLAFMAPAMASAQATSDHRTYFTFSGDVRLPGMTLPAGRYVFRFADGSTGRQVVQIVSDQGNKMYGFFMTIPARRMDYAKDAEVRFMETPAGTAPAIKTWWYPGYMTGNEFIYSRDEALRIARAASRPVLTTKAASVSDEQLKTTELSYVSPTGQDTAVTNEGNPVAVNLTGDSEVGQVEGTGLPPRAVQEGQQARAALPRTGSLLPLIGLFGLASLLGGASLRLRH
jgi:hypothetical protein